MSYQSFQSMESKMAGRPGVTNPAGLAAYIARRKYGNKALEQHAKSGTSMRNVKPLKKGKGKKSARHQAIDRYLSARGR